ncbi:hypothetical protein CRPA8_46140 [Pseudomonas aeruginosa]
MTSPRSKRDVSIERPPGPRASICASKTIRRDGASNPPAGDATAAAGACGCFAGAPVLASFAFAPATPAAPTEDQDWQEDSEGNSASRQANRRERTAIPPCIAIRNRATCPP